MVQGKIKLNSKTMGHKKWLTDHGYTVTEATIETKDRFGRIAPTLYLIVEVSEFVGYLDLRGGAEALREFVRAKKALTYMSQVMLPDGVVYTANRLAPNKGLLDKLGTASAIVMTPVGVSARPTSVKPPSEFDTI